MRNFWLVGLSALLCFFATYVSALPITTDLYDPEISHARLRGRQSGLQTSDNPADWPDNATLTRVLTSAPNRSFFWTGRVANVSMEGKALVTATAAGGNTLEGNLAAAGIKMPGFDVRNPEAVRVWTDASNIFARGASGDAFVVMGTSLRPGNVFDTSELPELKRNRRVIRVIKIDGATGRRTTIFNRNAAKEDAAAKEALARRNSCGAPPPTTTTPTRRVTQRRDLSYLPLALESTLEKRQAPAARNQRRKTAAAPACPLPGAAQNKKVIPRSATTPKPQANKAYPAQKPAARPPAPKRTVARPANRPKRAKGAAAPARKRSTPTKKPKVAPKPAAKPRGAPRRRR